jgi:LysM repeat protein
MSGKPSPNSSHHTYVVRPNDTLSGIAQQQLGSAHRWTEIAKANNVRDAHRLMIGQRLTLPEAGRQVDQFQRWRIAVPSNLGMPPHQRPATLLPGRAFMFVVADEMNPLTRRAVRKVLLPPKGVTDFAEIARLSHPEKFGFSPRNPGSPVSLGRHVGGRVDSRFISASERTFGSPRFEGQKFWINIDKARRAGVVVHESSDIIADLDRVTAKTRNPVQKANFQAIRKLSTTVDHELVFEGKIPAGAIKTGSMMAITKGAQVVSGVGIVLTAYDLEQAAQRSHDQHSIKPRAAETVRQAGGWGGALAGAELGAMTGVAVGIETGPGALVTGLIGGMIGGIAGFTGANWIASYIEP